MYAIQGLWSAAELALPVTFVIVNNGSYRALDEFAPHFGLAHAARHARCAHLDFCALARAQGVASGAGRAVAASLMRRCARPSPPPGRCWSRCASRTRPQSAPEYNRSKEQCP